VSAPPCFPAVVGSLSTKCIAFMFGVCLTWVAWHSWHSACAWSHTLIRIHLHIRAHTHTYTPTYTHPHIHPHAYQHLHTYPPTHAHTHAIGTECPLALPFRFVPPVHVVHSASALRPSPALNLHMSYADHDPHLPLLGVVLSIG
jgi:hypothetical protein